MALKWRETKSGEWSITPGRRLSTRIVRESPLQGDGWARSALGGPEGVSNSGVPSSVVAGRSLGASVPRARCIVANTEQTSEERASERCARELARAPARTLWWGGDGDGGVAILSERSARPSERSGRGGRASDAGRDVSGRGRGGKEPSSRP